MIDPPIDERVPPTMPRERARSGRRSIAARRDSAPGLAPEQLARFSVSALHAHPTRGFDPDVVVRQLRAHEGQRVVAVDMGGDKLVAATRSVSRGTLTLLDEPRLLRGDGGAGYLDILEELAKEARATATPVGISFAGPLVGTSVVGGPNLPVLTAALHARYAGDFANLFPHVAVANDAEAGLMAGAVEAVRRFPGVRDVIYLINGSGIGGAVLANGTIWAAEPGHIEVVGPLNPFGRDEPCGVFGATYVCLENVAGGRAGIEDTWRLRTGARLGGREIAARYEAGDGLAAALYASSALVVAHAIRGQADAFGLALASERTAVVCHGGVFRVPGYGDRVRAILERDLGDSIRLLLTEEFSDNACLDGAAVAVLARSSPV